MLLLKAHVSLSASSDINAGSEVAEHGAVPTSGDFAMLHRTGQRPATAGYWLRGREQRNSLVKIMLRLGVKAGAADGGTRTCFSGAWACGISVAAFDSAVDFVSCVCRRLHDGHLNFGGRNYFYDKAKFIQKWGWACEYLVWRR